MPQSLSFVVVHVIFSTKDRLALIDADIRPRLHAYLATLARNAGCECYRAGGVADHVHLAIRLSRTVTIAGLVEDLKTSSSKWTKSESRLPAFSWQRGYGCFSVSPTDLDLLCAYIDNQEEHHSIRGRVSNVPEEVRCRIQRSICVGLMRVSEMMDRAFIPES